MALTMLNFEETNATATVLKLFELKRWVENVVRHSRLLGPGEDFGQVRAAERVESADSIQRTGEWTFWDKLFMNDVNTLVRQTVQAYKLTNYKAALKSGFYVFTAARDSYRAGTHSAGLGMHHACVRQYIECQVLLKPSTIQLERFPTVPDPSPNLQATSDHVKATTARILAAHASHQKRVAKGARKGSASGFGTSRDKRLNVYVATSWPAWQRRHIDLARELFDGAGLDDVRAVARRVARTRPR
ncbi:hypothetical protein VTK26DRAFT_9481 [Humicola hyalothermophila]